MQLTRRRFDTGGLPYPLHDLPSVHGRGRRHFQAVTRDRVNVLTRAIVALPILRRKRLRSWMRLSPWGDGLNAELEPHFQASLDAEWDKVCSLIRSLARANREVSTETSSIKAFSRHQKTIQHLAQIVQQNSAFNASLLRPIRI